MNKHPIKPLLFLCIWGGVIFFTIAAIITDQQPHLSHAKIISDPDEISITLMPATATNPVGTPHTVTATVFNVSEQLPVVNQVIKFQVSGENSSEVTGTTTDTSGQATFTYTGTVAGDDTIFVWIDEDNDNIRDSGEVYYDTASQTLTTDANTGIYLPIIYRSFCDAVFITDTFASKVNGWPDDDVKETNENVITKYTSDGEYLIATKKESLYAVRESQENFDDFEVEVDIHWARPTDDQYSGKQSGKGHGIFFNLDRGTINDPEDYYYLFYINTDRQTYNLWRYSSALSPPGKPLSSDANKGWVYTDAIKSGTETNHIKIIRSNSLITIFINNNDVPVLEVSNNEIPPGHIALAVQAYYNDPDYGNKNADARFDNFSFRGCPTTLPTTHNFSASTIQELISSPPTPLN